MMIAQRLAPLLVQHFSDKRMRLPEIESGDQFPVRVAVLSAEKEEVGDVIVEDDGDEVTVYLGHFSHVHIGCYAEGLTVPEKEEEIADQTVEFLSRVFADEVEFFERWWGGGSGPRGSREGEVFVWSRGRVING